MREFSNNYLNFIKNNLKGLNLTNIFDEEEFFNKQICDSILPIEKSECLKKLLVEIELIVDVGFGGGFPIIPLAWKFPQYKFLGLEARKKKVVAVNQIKKYFKLENVLLNHMRFENVLFDRTVIILFKAVGNIVDILSRLNFSNNIYVFFYKGPNVHQLEDFNRISNKWEQVENKFFELPGTNGRYLVGLKNKNVPRGTFKDNNLVKLSEII